MTLFNGLYNNTIKGFSVRIIHTGSKLCIYLYMYIELKNIIIKI